MSNWDSSGWPFNNPPPCQPSGERTAGTSGVDHPTSHEHHIWTQDHSSFPAYNNPGAASSSGDQYPQTYGELTDYDLLPSFDTYASVSDDRSEYPPDYREAPQREDTINSITSTSGDSAPRGRDHFPQATDSSSPLLGLRERFHESWMALAKRYAGTGFPIPSILEIFNEGKSGSDRLSLSTARTWIAEYNSTNRHNPIGAIPKYGEAVRKQFIAFAEPHLRSTPILKVIDLFNEKFSIELTYATASNWLWDYNRKQPNKLIRTLKRYSKEYIQDFLQFAKNYSAPKNKTQLIKDWNASQPLEKQVGVSSAMRWLTN